MEALYQQAETKMQKIHEHFALDLASIRSGRANPSLLDSIMVEVYGSYMPLPNVASVSVQDARTLLVSVWDASNIKKVDNAIRTSELSLNPRIDGNNLFLSLPELTEERRQEYVKIVKKKAEDAKVFIRNQRRDVNDTFKAKEKSKEISQDELNKFLDRTQKATDKFIALIDKTSETKQKELLSV